MNFLIKSYRDQKKSPLLLFFLIVFCFNPFPILSQDIDAENSERNDTISTIKELKNITISVFLDCNSCDNNYIRQNLNFVNYVRDPELGKVHLFITRQGTASGGRMYELSFIGEKEFEGINNTLTYTSVQTNTWDKERNGLNSMIKLGLIPYLAQTSLATNISVDISGEKIEQEPQEDPWNNWIFKIYGGARFNKESRKGSLDIRYGLYADYVTSTWRIRLRPYFNYNEDTYVKDEEDVLSVLHRDGFEGKVIRSISNHWSLGVFTDAISNTYANIDFGYRVAPAIEYSLLPYKMALRKEYTLAYSAGYLRRNYSEETIFGKNKESLYNQSLKMEVRVLQPWGSIRGGLEGSHYFHDLSKKRISIDSNLSMRLFKGFSMNFSADYDLVHDQLSLPQGDTSFEEVLLGQRQLATTYGISFSAGLSYSFGSIYNNIVNTRL